MLQGKKVVIFDMDGTLIDSIGLWNEIDRKLIVQLGGTPPAEERIQANRDEQLTRLRTSPSPYVDYCGSLRDMYATIAPLPSDDEVMRIRYGIAQESLLTVDYKKDAESVLKYLKNRGFTLVLASTTGRVNITIYSTKNQNLVSKAPLGEIFDLMLTREDVQTIKPDPEVYLAVMRHFAASPEECLIFEDSLIGIEAANRANIPVVAMYDRYSDKDREAINRLSQYQFADFAAVLHAFGGQ